VLLLTLCCAALAEGGFGVTESRTAEHICFPKQMIRYSKAAVMELKDLLQGYPNLKRVDMYEVSMDKQVMDALFDGFPQIDFGFTLHFGRKYFKNDIRYYSSRHSDKSKRFREGYYDQLRFCKNLEILDLGHNQIGRIDFVAGLTKLQVLILADNDIVDISPLANLKELTYFEAFRNRISDLSPLAGLPKLKDINLVYNRVSDISMLYACKQLERLWLSHNPIPEEQRAALAQQLPQALTNYVVHSPTSDGWREHERYFEITKLLEENQ